MLWTTPWLQTNNPWWSLWDSKWSARLYFLRGLVCLIASQTLLTRASAGKVFPVFNWILFISPRLQLSIITGSSHQDNLEDTEWFDWQYSPLFELTGTVSVSPRELLAAESVGVLFLYQHRNKHYLYEEPPSSVWSDTGYSQLHTSKPVAGKTEKLVLVGCRIWQNVNQCSQWVWWDHQCWMYTISL